MLRPSTVRVVLQYYQFLYRNTSGFYRQQFSKTQQQFREMHQGGLKGGSPAQDVANVPDSPARKAATNGNGKAWPAGCAYAPMPEAAVKAALLRPRLTALVAFIKGLCHHASSALVRTPNELWRENQQPVITVTAELGDRDLGSLNRDLETRLAKLKFPLGYRWELAGNYRVQQEVFGSLLAVLVVASTIVFLLLGFQFRSLLLPLLIFLSQPISLAMLWRPCGSPIRR